MKKLSKEQLVTRDKLCERVRQLEEKVPELYEGYIKAIETLNAHLSELNEALGDAESFRQDIEQRMRDHVDNRSEAWTSGDKGQAYQEWLEQWAYPITERDLVEPQELTEPEGIDELEQAASELEF